MTFVLAAIATTSFLLVGCGDQDKDADKDAKSNANEGTQLRPLGSTTLSLMNSAGAPISDAEVTIGSTIMTTNAKGAFTTPSSWTSAQALTVVAPGYTTTTFYDFTAQDGMLEVQESDGTQNLEISGANTDFGAIRNEGKVHFALVLPQLKRRDLLQFDMSLMISPENDTLSVAGKSLPIPSNLSLPTQRQTYIFPITLSKPGYRTFVRKPKIYKYSSTRGTFPIGSVVNEIRNGKSIFQIMNYFDFTSAGTAEIVVTSQGAKQDFSVGQVKFDGSFTVQGPALPEKQLMVALALNEKDSSMWATDLKRVASDRIQSLKTTKDTLSKYLLSILKKEDVGESIDFGQLSFALQKFSLEATDTKLAAPTFLELVAPPAVLGNTIALTPPKVPPGIQPLGTYLIYSKIERMSDGQLQTERRTRLWEVVSSKWLSRVNLPNVVIVKEPGTTYRWEVMFLGRRGEGQGESLFENVTHISRNLVDL